MLIAFEILRNLGIPERASRRVARALVLGCVVACGNGENAAEPGSGADTRDSGRSDGGSGGSDGGGGSSEDGGGNGDVDGGGGGPTDGGSGACTTTTTLATGDTTGSVQIGGATRTYIVHIPTSYTGQTLVPLVLDFHGLGASAANQESSSGYKELSDQNGFIAAWPQGIDNAWNVGPCCTTSRTVDDAAFAKALIGQIEGQACIDSKRVYAAGMSNGGGAALYMACNAADVFAAVAPSSFDLAVASDEPCNPSRPITEIAFRGTADTIVPYDGGVTSAPNGSGLGINFIGAVGTFQKWASLNQCTGSPSAADSDGCSTYSQCQGGVEVTLCTMQGKGHVPGSAQVGWDMIKRFSLP